MVPLDTSSDSETHAASITRPTLALAMSAVVGLLVGFLTSFGQGQLPHGIAPLANSAGSWVAVAFVVAVIGRRGVPGAVLGPVALAAMVAGYFLAAELRGYGWSQSFVVFWLAMALVAGPVVGLGASWVGSESAPKAGLAATPVIGVLVGEGIYGITTISETTSVGYWIGSIAAGAALLILSAARLRDRWRAVAYLSAGSVAAAAVFLGAVRVLGGVSG